MSAGDPARVAEVVLGEALGAEAPVLSPQGGGLTNVVFHAETAQGRYIVRLNAEPGRLAVFQRECEAIDHARDADVRVPEMLAVGERDGFAYTVAHCLQGDSAVDHPLRLEVVEDLGRLAARLHRVRTTGHGCAFGWEGEPSTARASWRGWLEDELRASARLDALRRRGLISARQHEAFARTLDEVTAWQGPAVLNHGDLRLKNVVVDEDGVIRGLIDWDSCVSAIGSHWDLSIALHDLSIDAKQAFLAGYGLTEAEVREAAPAWRLFNVLNYAPEADRVAEAGDGAGLARLATRLSGALDLYAAA